MISSCHADTYTELTYGASPFGADSIHFKPWFKFKTSHFSQLPSQKSLVTLALIRDGFDFFPNGPHSASITISTETKGDFNKVFEYHPGNGIMFSVVWGEYELADITAIHVEYDIHTYLVSNQPTIEPNFSVANWSIEVEKLVFPQTEEIGDKLTINESVNNGNYYLSFNVTNWNNTVSDVDVPTQELTLYANATNGKLFYPTGDLDCHYYHSGGNGTFHTTFVSPVEPTIGWYLNKPFPHGENVQINCYDVQLKLEHFESKQETSWNLHLGEVGKPPYQISTTTANFGPEKLPLKIAIEPTSTYSSLLKFEISQFPNVLLNGYDYAVNVQLFDVILHDNYSQINSTQPVHHITKTTHQTTPVIVTPDWIHTAGENTFHLNLTFTEPKGPATQFDLQFELSTLYIGPESYVEVEIIPIAYPDSSYKLTSKKITFLPHLTLNNEPVTATYLSIKDNKQQRGFEITIPQTAVPFNSLFALQTNATMVNIDHQGIFKPLHDETCTITVDRKKSHKFKPFVDFYSQTLFFNFTTIPEFHLVGKPFTINCINWVIETPVPQLNEVYLSYSLSLVLTKEHNVSNLFEFDFINADFVPYTSTWTMESISTAKTKDQPPQHYIFIILFIGLAVMAIIGGIGYHFLFRKPKNENQKQTSLLDDGTLHDDSYHQVI
jgi:hypothetical protein